MDQIASTAGIFRCVQDVPRTIWWDGDGVAVLDQTQLPHDVAVVHWYTVEAAAHGISTMQVRGAPLIGVAAAHGVALAMAADASDASLDSALDGLGRIRPTAVNLRWALQRVDAALRNRPPSERAEAARRIATELADEDAATCRTLGEIGLPLLRAAAERRGEGAVQVLTHCNAGRLACVEWGTATAPIYLAAGSGLDVHVWVSETRPRNQGSALTAWELGQRGVPHTVVVDDAAGHLFREGLVDLCLIGADRIAANGDVANKVGTYLKALAAHDNDVPFHVVAPTSSVDHSAAEGTAIPIEERDATEVTTLAGVALAPAATPARNWAFDVTPARLITDLVTERGIVPATPAGVGSLR
jgi:methylthioribose-1-phosphate isomerase